MVASRAIGDAVEFDQRGAAHGADDVWIYWHGYVLSFGLWFDRVRYRFGA